MRHNASILEQYAQPNAPDPRESHPPCYDDAILLPKFTGSFASLKGRWIADDRDEIDAPMRNRCRSEEVNLIKKAFNLFISQLSLFPERSFRHVRALSSRTVQHAGK